MAAENGLECQVLGQEHMKELGMGALLGVAQGSAEPPALIVLRYRPMEETGAAHLGWSARASPSTAAAFPSSPPRTWTR